MITFEEAFDRLIGHEGGYSDDPTDNGNWTGGKRGAGLLKGTKYGIGADDPRPARKRVDRRRGDES